MMVGKHPKIQDVAKAAGVSTATVSRALSNPELLTRTTRDAVEEAIRITGYRVNQAARSLRRQQAGAVLVLVPNLGNPFFSQILAGISAGFAGSDWSVLIADTTELPKSSRRLVDYFLDARIDGILSLDGGLGEDELAQLTAYGLADRLIFACEWAATIPAQSVRSDNRAGTRAAIRHLYDLGHRKIAHVTGPVSNVLTRERRDAVLAERHRLELPVRNEWIIRGDFSLTSGNEAAQRILAMQDRPTAVFCASDMVAFGLISGLIKGGLDVPGDISVVGFDDIEQSAFFVPALTTIRQNRRHLGQRAAEILRARLDGSGKPAPNVQDFAEIISVELVVRDSSGPVTDKA